MQTKHWSLDSPNPPNLVRTGLVANSWTRNRKEWVMHVTDHGTQVGHQMTNLIHRSQPYRWRTCARWALVGLPSSTLIRWRPIWGGKTNLGDRLLWDPLDYLIMDQVRSFGRTWLGDNGCEGNLGFYTVGAHYLRVSLTIGEEPLVSETRFLCVL